MDRRDFLKILGLGGVALTLPRPAGIVAAKMEALAAPPLHVGRCLIGPLADDERTFLMDKIGVGVDHATTAERYADYREKWAVAVFRRFMVGDKVSRSTVLRVRSSFMPDPTRSRRVVYEPNDDVELDGKETKAVEVPEFFSCHHAYRFSPGESLEFWYMPASRHDLPRFPLPKLTVSLGGYMIYKRELPRDALRTLAYHLIGDVQTMQLERGKAIEMGLCLPGEEEGIIA